MKVSKNQNLCHEGQTNEEDSDHPLQVQRINIYQDTKKTISTCQEENKLQGA